MGPEALGASRGRPGRSDATAPARTEMGSAGQEDPARAHDPPPTPLLARSPRPVLSGWVQGPEPFEVCSSEWSPRPSDPRLSGCLNPAVAGSVRRVFTPQEASGRAPQPRHPRDRPWATDSEAGPKAEALEVGWTVGASPRFTRLPWVIYLWLNGLPAGKFVWLQHKPVNPLPSVLICR